MKSYSLDLFHVIPQFVYCYRSKGSESRSTVARIHGLSRIWQQVLLRSPEYVVEVISERYERLSKEDKENFLIHELMHIPKGFSGGFRPRARTKNDRNQGQTCVSSCKLCFHGEEK